MVTTAQTRLGQRHASDGRRVAETVERLAAVEPGPEDTAILFRRNEEGREFRRRATAGTLTPHDISRVPECFHDLLKHLASPVSKATGLPVHCTDYETMIDGDGAPRRFDFATVRRKLGSIAKQKAPGLSGNGPDLYACMPDCWVEWAVTLCNIIQHSQVTPRAWHVDLVHYVHKGGSDISLSNHRPLALVEVFRKVFTSVIIDRMRRDWNRLQVLDSCNPGFHAGRTTANSIYPVRTAAEYCVQSKTELAALLDDLRWCFDTPANTVIELALFRLGVPEFYCNFLNDIDLHSVKSTITAAGFTLDILLAMGAEGTHRQEHGTGQGTTEGPLNWIPVADMVISVARAASTQPVQVPSGNGTPTPVSKSWYVDDSALMQSGRKALEALSRMVNATGLMYYFLGLERRAKKCLWVRLCWVNGWLQRKAARPGEQLLCKEWITVWGSDSVAIVERKPTVVKEYDYDEEFRHLGYSASVIGSSAAAETELTKIARRATTVFMCKPGLRDCGANIVASVIVPKVVYPLAFAKARKKTVETIESGYGNMLRRSMGVAQGFPWEVLSGSPEFDGLGALRLTTEVTKARLRQFQSLISSTYESETSLAMGMLRMAQRWGGLSHPVNMMDVKHLRLLQPVDSTAPQAVHLISELRELGYKLAVGWVSRPRAESDLSIVDCYLAAAGDTGRDDADVAALQRWRRRHDIMWVSELLRADGRTLRHRFGHDLKRRVDNCEDEALRLCSIAFGSGLTPPSVRPRVGRALRAAWDDVRAGEYIWHSGVLCEVQQLGSSTVSLITYGCVEGTAENRDTQHCFEADGEGEISYDAQLVLVDNVREAGGGKVLVAGDELLVVRAAEDAMASGGETEESLQPDHPCKNDIPNSGIVDRSCVTSAHETLPWGSHYRNLVTASGHAWVAFALEHDPQVRDAAILAQAVAELQTHDDGDDTDDNIPVLDAYSDGSVLAKGVEGSAAALVRVFGTDVSATVRLASVDVALSSGRSEWAGLVMVLYILREVRASVVLRLDNL